MRKKNWLLFGFLLLFFYPLGAQGIEANFYYEDFNGWEDNAVIDGVDSWKVDQGDPSAAITQSLITYGSSGKSLEMTGVETIVDISRSAVYGDISPCWIEFLVNPGIGSEIRDIPTGKIAAVTFDYTGKIYASNGSRWEDTGVTFTAGEWYRILLRVDFDNHDYNIYIEPINEPKTQFIADKSGLAFIDTSINSLSQIGLEGVYNVTRNDDSYIDDLCVNFVDRLKIVTSLQNIKQDTPSAAITVQLQDAFSEPQTAWTDFILELKSTSESGQFSVDDTDWSAIDQIVLPKGAQEATFYYKDSESGTPIITAKEYPDKGWTQASQEITITAETALFTVAATTPQVAGQAFPITITAWDDDGRINEFYDGEVILLVSYVSPDTGGLGISPASVSEFNNGLAQVEVKYLDCGIIKIAVQDSGDSSKTGVSGEILVTPSAFTVFADSPQVVNKTFVLNVSAVNAEGETTPNYQGPASLSVTAVSPEENSGSISLTSLDSGDFSLGIFTGDVSYNRWGMIQLKAYDTNYPDRSGVSDFLNFIPGGISAKIEFPSPDRDFFYVGESIVISLSAFDENGETIPNYQGLVNINSTLGLSLPENYQFEAADNGKHNFFTSISSPGFYEASFEDEATGLTGDSPRIQVKNATLEVISTVATIGTGEIVIKLVDDSGNVIEAENDLSIEVSLEEEYADNSASSLATKTPITFTGGIAKVLISNSQAETVTVSPSSEYDFKVRKGTITFGRIAKTGIGALMWREIKD